ncbi:VWA domain-containing protein [Geodermatophilus sp. SYSU D00691]
MLALSVLVGALTAGLVAGPSPALAAPSATGTSSLQDLGACLSETKNADVLLLVDESGSLRRTDPGDARVAAASLLLRRLTDTAARTGSTIDVAVRGFAGDVRSAFEWQPLGDHSLSAASAAVADFAGRENGFETDYWTALTTARQQLVDHREPDAEQPPCQALVLFTDGQYELSARDTPEERQQYGETKPIPGAETIPLTSDDAAAQVAAKGQEDICRSGGVADQLRNDDILLIALGLSDAGSVDLSLLSSIAEAQPNPCGDTAPYGVFLEADDVGDLVLAFDAVGDPGNPPQPVDQQGVCVGAACPQEVHEFTLDASIQSIHLVGTSSAAGIVVQVQPPGLPVPVQMAYDPAAPAGTVRAGDLALTYNWYGDDALSLDAAIPPSGDNWSGPWQVVFIDPTGQNPQAVTRTQLTIQADLGAVVHPHASVEWRVGEDLGPVRIALVRSDGTPAVLGDPAPTLALDVVLASADGTETMLAQGVPGAQLAAGVPLAVPDDVAPGPAELQTVLAVTTVSGQVLQPQVRTQEVTVAPPLGFPTLVSESVDFGAIEGTTASTATIEVTGPGCAWVTGGGLRVRPAEVEGVTVTGSDAQSHCLADGETAEIPVELAPGAAADGQLQGDLVVHLAPEGLDLEQRTERAVQATVPYTADLQLLANTKVLLLAFVLALLVGIGLPLLVFLLGRRLAAKLPGTPLQSALLDVRVSPGGLLAAGGGTLPAPDWELVPPPQAGRRRGVLSGVPVRARAGARFTEAGFAEVDDPAGVGVSGAPGSRSGKLRARLPLALQGSWTVLLDRSAAESDTPEVPAKLLLVTDALATAEQRAELVGRAHSEGPSAVEDLRDAARTARPADGADGSAGPARTAASDDPFAPGPFGGAADPFAPGGRTASDPFAPAADPFATAPRSGPPGNAAPVADPFASGSAHGTPGPASWPAPGDDPFRR